MSCGSPHDQDCREVLDRVFEYLDGEMSGSDRDQIRVHLAECGPCLHEYDLDEALKSLVRRSWGCEPAPHTLRLRILARITELRVQG